MKIDYLVLLSRGQAAQMNVRSVYYHVKECYERHENYITFQIFPLLLFGCFY